MAQWNVTPGLPMNAHNLRNGRFGRLTAVRYEQSSKNAQWLCFCECGNDCVVRADHLTQGRVRSCGCLASELVSARTTTHGETRGHQLTREYRCWYAMHSRCRDMKDSRYGGRGIKVCERWTSFENFLADMGRCPEGLTLDRINNNSGYSSDNCRWADAKAQNRNRSSNRQITFNGRTMCLADWCDDTGLPRTTLERRLNRGWPIEAALTTPRRQQVDKIRPEEFRGIDTRRNHHRVIKQ